MAHTPQATASAPISTDGLIIGAGSTGLFQAFELGLLGVHAHIVDVLPYAGGQCMELYPDKPIFDIPGVPACTGRELTANLLRQVAPFAPTFHWEQQVSSLQRQEDGDFRVETAQGICFLAKTVFIAAGVGAFVPRTLQLPGLNALQHPQIAYAATDPHVYAGKKVLILGDNDAALACALRLSHDNACATQAAHVTLVHRRDHFVADAALQAQFRERVQAQKIDFYAGQITGYDAPLDRIQALTITQPDASQIAVPVDALLVFWGLSPKLGPISDWGLAMERKQLQVDTEKFETSERGIFAVGDINTYPGKKKLILCGFHESTLAAFAAAAIIFPEKKIMLQYTTSSTQLQQALGVSKTA